MLEVVLLAIYWVDVVMRYSPWIALIISRRSLCYYLVTFLLSNFSIPLCMLYLAVLITAYKSVSSLQLYRLLWLWK